MRKSNADKEGSCQYIDLSQQFAARTVRPLPAEPTTALPTVAAECTIAAGILVFLLFNHSLNQHFKETVPVTEKHFTPSHLTIEREMTCEEHGSRKTNFLT